jgi:hypothetical protein
MKEIKSKYGVSYKDPNYQKMVQQKQLETHINMRIKKTIKRDLDVIKSNVMLKTGKRVHYNEILEEAMNLYKEKYEQD